MRKFFKGLIASSALASAAALSGANQALASEYKFHVSCPGQIFVARWPTGSIDPGQEYFRVMTGTRFPGCGVGDYNPGPDASLPVRDMNGWVDGVPPINFLKSLFGG